MAAPTILLLLLALFLCNHLSSIALAQRKINNTIQLGSGLIAGSNSSWVSPNADFAFGFYRLPSNRFLLGIWFNKIPERTLVWSLNRNEPVQAGSTFNLTRTGRLLLTHANGTRVLFHNGTNVGFAELQNNGNFALFDNSSGIVWQSFDFPTDTLLPGQELRLGQKLYSNANSSVSDYSIGKFSLEVQSLDGNILLSAFLVAEPAYWYTATAGNSNVTLIFNSSTSLLYARSGVRIIYEMSRDSMVPKPIRDYYHRSTVNDLGNFQQLAYRKNGTDWVVVWEAIDQPCTVFNICGLNGFCSVKDDNKTVICECLPGFSPVDPKIPSKGCYMSRVVDFCERGFSDSNGYDIVTIRDADSPDDASADFRRNSSGDSDECFNLVKDDCLSVAGVFDPNESVCIRKRMPLVNARISHPATNGKVMFIKVPKTTTGEDHNQTGTIAVLGCSLFVCSALAVAFAFVALSHHPLAQQHYRRINELSKPKTGEIYPKVFTFSELQEGTNGFKNKLGQGAFGTVYRGVLKIDNEEVEVAVKRLENVAEQGDREFSTEVRIISLTHHKNLVGLLGFCYEKNHRLLVYKLMNNRSLSDFLFTEEKRLSWQRRAEIVSEISRGLLYLHEECETQIIHCDIKPQNVLLDDSLTAKISDFGISKLLMKDQTRTKTNIRGTIGYMAPEWLKYSPVTSKIDVYSFGVMLFEIILCRRNTDLIPGDGENSSEMMILVDWIICFVKTGNLKEIAGDDCEMLGDFNRFQRLVMVGLWCVSPNPNFRPSMKTVTEMLEGMVDVGVPPVVDPSNC